MANLSAIMKELSKERDRLHQQLSGLNAALEAFVGVYHQHLDLPHLANYFSDMCSLDQPDHSLQAYAVSMSPITDNPIPKLRKASQPPLSYPGAIPDSDRAKKPPLVEPPATDQELNPGDRVEGLGNFGKPTGELGTVEQTNEEDAIVKWDDDGRVRRHQPSLKKV